MDEVYLRQRELLTVTAPSTGLSLRCQRDGRNDVAGHGRRPTAS